MTVEQVAEIEAIAAEQEEFNEAVTQEAAESKADTKEIIIPVLTMAFGVLAPNWNVQKEEIEQLSMAYGDLLDKYYPDGVGRYSVEATAILITSAVILPRIKTPRKAQQETESAGVENGD